jgi:hypothetical protein
MGGCAPLLLAPCAPTACRTRRRPDGRPTDSHTPAIRSQTTNHKHHQNIRDHSPTTNYQLPTTSASSATPATYSPLLPPNPYLHHTCRGYIKHHYKYTHTCRTSLCIRSLAYKMMVSSNMSVCKAKFKRVCGSCVPIKNGPLEGEKE